MRTRLGRKVFKALRPKPCVMTRRGLLAGALAGGLAMPACADRGQDGLPIVVIGAGVSGLTAALTLQDLGATVEVYEASRRLGGRVHTVSDEFAQGVQTEYGAEFIDAAHTDMLALVRRFDLPLTALADAPAGPAPASAFYLAGSRQSGQRLTALLAPLRARLQRESQRLDEQGWRAQAALDALSVQDYLDQGPPLDPLALSLVQAAIRSEFGVEMAQSSALQLLDAGADFASADEEGAEREGAEAFTLTGGNQRLIEAMAAALRQPPQTGKRLAWLRGSLENGFDAIMLGGQVVRASQVVLALPPRALAGVRLDVALPQTLRAWLARLTLGQNEKAVFGFRGRPWRARGGFSAEAYGDWGFTTVWDSARSHPTVDGALSFFQGGSLAAAGLPADPALLAGLDRFVPVSPTFNGRAHRTAWGTDPMSGGGYLSLGPGQRTDPERPRWEESHTDHAVRPVVHEGVAFVGEHLSEEFYGFMNGAAQTGRLAAHWLLNRRR
jgi:monoamine oxidase